MIYFEDLPLDKEILKALSELKINYVWVPAKAILESVLMVQA